MIGVERCGLFYAYIHLDKKVSIPICQHLMKINTIS